MEMMRLSAEDVLKRHDKALIRKENFDRYSFDGVVEWWKNKASKRFESLKADGRLRTELETWNCADDIDIIR